MAEPKKAASKKTPRKNEEPSKQRPAEEETADTPTPGIQAEQADSTATDDQQGDQSSSDEEQSGEASDKDEDSEESEPRNIKQYRPRHPPLQNAGRDQHAAEEEREAARARQREEHARRVGDASLR